MARFRSQQTQHFRSGALPLTRPGSGGMVKLSG